jgi:hypothetical protein
LEELGQLEGKKVWIKLKDDNPIFKRPYKHSEVERVLVDA